MTSHSMILGTLSLIAIGLGTSLLICKRAHWILNLFLIIEGILLASGFAIVQDLPQLSLAIRMRIVLGSFSFLVLIITLEAVRRFAMEVRYALLWVFTGLTLVIFAVHPDAVGWLAKTTGMTYVSAITIVVFGFLLIIAFHYSIALSALRENQKRLSQKIAELELRLEQLKK